MPTPGDAEASQPDAEEPLPSAAATQALSEEGYAVEVPPVSEDSAFASATTDAVPVAPAPSRVDAADIRISGFSTSTASTASPASPHPHPPVLDVSEGAAHTQGVVAAPIGPPESVEPATIYKLYRGTNGEINRQPLRVWVDFPALQLCWAGYDLPAWDDDSRRSLLDLTRCCCETLDDGCHRVEVYTVAQGTGPLDGKESRSARREEPTEFDEKLFSITPPESDEKLLGTNLFDFGEALQQLIKSREEDRQGGVEWPGVKFIQKRLFQYLWKHQGGTRTQEQHYEAQAVLAFNLEPKEGVAYLKNKLNKRTEEEIGEWIALMATEKGGLDPTLLGNYFSRRDTLETFRAFVRCLDFKGIDIVVALRKLFDTFKPGGEGQVITRILEYFSEAYFDQWRTSNEVIDPRVAYANPDSVLQVAVSLIMLNTGLHVATKKIGKKAPGAAMTADQYISNTRLVVPDTEVPEPALRAWYDAVRIAEISVEPLPRSSFSQLPVQPDIEGWLIVCLGPQMSKRYWAVLALQRLYLFSDVDEVNTEHVIDLKDIKVVNVAEDKTAQDRLARALLRARPGMWTCCMGARSGIDIKDAESRAFEVSRDGADKPAILTHQQKPRRCVALLAESSDLMEKWVNLIAAGPY